MSWGEDLVFPTVRSGRDLDILRTLLRHPKIGRERGDWQFRPVAELHATGDRHLFHFGEPQEGMWPVYSGSSFDIWMPETGDVYAWADPDIVRPHLFRKRQRQARTRSSAFYGLDEQVVSDISTLPCNSPRIAFRDVTNRTNQRTLLVALIPPHRVLQHKAPYLVRIKGDETDEAYVLAFLSSRILDWVARQSVETNMTFTVFNPLPVPAPEGDHPGRLRVIALAGRLAAVDDRYADWAAKVGVDYGPIPSDEADDMKAELDACVARLYGLDEQQIRDLFATFHPTWDHEPWTEAVLEHYRKITWGPAGVPE